MSYGPCVEHLEPGRDRGSRSGPGRESPGAVHGILWKIRLPPPFVVICKRFFESRAHAFYLNPSVSLCMLSVEAQAQLTPLTPLTPLTAWLKGRVPGQHTCPYGLRPRSILTPLTPLTPLTAWLNPCQGEGAWSAHQPLRTASKIDTHSTYFSQSAHSTHRLAQGEGAWSAHLPLRTASEITVTLYIPTTTTTKDDDEGRRRRR